MMRWVYPLILASLASAKVYLEHIRYPINTEPATSPLRGVTKGDIWGPPVKGANKVHCGQFGADDYLGDRIKIKPTESFYLNGVVGDPLHGGKLIFEVACGDENPNFDLAGILFLPEILAEYSVPKQALPYKWQCMLKISERHEPGSCTLQVTYSPEDLLIPNNYQCVDIELLPNLSLVEQPAFWGVASFIIGSMVCSAMCLHSRRKKSKKTDDKVERTDESEDDNVDKGTQEALDLYAVQHLPNKGEMLEVKPPEKDCKKLETILSKVEEVPEDEQDSGNNEKQPVLLYDQKSKEKQPLTGSKVNHVPPSHKFVDNAKLDSKGVSKKELSSSEKTLPEEQPLKRIYSPSGNEPSYQSDKSESSLFADIGNVTNPLEPELPPMIMQIPIVDSAPKWSSKDHSPQNSKYSKNSNSHSAMLTEDTEDGDVESVDGSEDDMYGSESSQHSESSEHSESDEAGDLPLPPPVIPHPDDEGGEFVFKYD